MLSPAPEDAMAGLTAGFDWRCGDLVYGTTGVAATRARMFEPGFSSKEDTFTNLVIGAGLDYMVSDKVSLGFDVLHLVEGDDPILDPEFCSTCGVTSFSMTLARVSVGYHF